MSGQRSSDVLGALPHSRPHRRSQKRAARPAEGASQASGPAPAKKAAASPGPAKRSSTAKAKPTGPRSSGSAKAQSNGSAKPQSSGSAKPRSSAQPRPARSTPRQGARLRQPAQPTGTPSGTRTGQPDPADRHDILGTAVQAAAELAEIGLTVSARALRGAVSRLPRP